MTGDTSGQNTVRIAKAAEEVNQAAWLEVLLEQIKGGRTLTMSAKWSLLGREQKVDRGSRSRIGIVTVAFL